MASHDADPRYQSRRSRERIAMLYMPLLSIVMDNLANLYHGGDGWDDWAGSFERLAIVVAMTTTGSLHWNGSSTNSSNHGQANSNLVGQIYYSFPMGKPMILRSNVPVANRLPILVSISIVQWKFWMARFQKQLFQTELCSEK